MKPIKTGLRMLMFVTMACLAGGTTISLITWLALDQPHWNIGIGLGVCAIFFYGVVPVLYVCEGVFTSIGGWLLHVVVLSCIGGAVFSTALWLFIDTPHWDIGAILAGVSVILNTIWPLFNKKNELKKEIAVTIETPKVVVQETPQTQEPQPQNNEEEHDNRIPRRFSKDTIGIHTAIDKMLERAKKKKAK